MFFSRRAFARSSRMLRPAVSSMKIRLSASFEAALVSCGKSRSDRKPSRIFDMLTRAREHSSRCTSDCALISRLKTATGCLPSTATCSAMFMASAVLPIEGRAAITIISEPCRPLVMRSRSLKPVESPVVAPFRS